jgi:inosine-uridine nucleoside N-ribohydrolase
MEKQGSIAMPNFLSLRNVLFFEARSYSLGAIPENGIVYMHKKISTCPTPVTLICTACLTNIALLLRTFPDVVEHIKEIVVLGGAIGIGNMSPCAEWNIMVCDWSTRIYAQEVEW